MADEKYWSTYIDVRRVDLIETWSKLDDFTKNDSCSDDVFAALKSLDAAERRYIDNTHPITPQHCVAFLDALQRDITQWNTVYQGTNAVRTTGDTMKRLDIPTWMPVR